MISFDEIRTVVSNQPPQVALVLGSGLSEIAARMSLLNTWSFADLAGFVPVHVEGHRGQLIHGVWAGKSILLFAGRIHYYEGVGWDAVKAPIRLAAQLGCRYLILTNAAGGVRPEFQPGTLMCLFHHLKCTQPRWWARGVQKSDPIWYSYQLNDKLVAIAKELGTTLERGIYACLTGPSYETPAEVRALRIMGADAVGMSTAIEAEEAYPLGLQTVGISCIANRAVDLSPAPLSHAEVLVEMKKAAKGLGDLLERFLLQLEAP
jgi:purine-nucleoside phosphorylase